MIIDELDLERALEDAYWERVQRHWCLNRPIEKDWEDLDRWEVQEAEMMYNESLVMDELRYNPNKYYMVER